MNRLLVIAAGVGLATVAGAQGKTATQVNPVQYSANSKPGDVLVLPADQTPDRTQMREVVDISGEQSWDPVYDTSNTILYVPIPTGQLMTGIGWDVNLATIGYSWLSEARFYFDGSDRDGYGLFLTPGYLNGNPGTGYYVDALWDFADVAIPYIPIQADGQLWIELFDGYDDYPDAPDADWLATSLLTIQYSDVAPNIPTCGASTVIEDFDGGTWPPAGWSVVDNTTAGQVWQLESFFGRGNLTGGTGDCASIDGDLYGSGGTRDSELWSAPFTATAALAFEMYYNYLSGDYTDVDISTDGGATWTNLASYNTDTYGSINLDTTAYAGGSVQVRWHYNDSGVWAWYCQIDDVATADATIYASAASRNAGTNPASLTVSGPPAFDLYMGVDLDVGSTGHNFGQVFGYAGSLTYTLPGGQTVLTDFTDPMGELLLLPVLAGPMVHYDLAVPGVCGLYGLGVSLQGAHFGGAPWVLSNAQDVVVGY